MIEQERREEGKDLVSEVREDKKQNEERTRRDTR